MTAATKIEWADSTFNPWIGCTKISPACDHCYAEAQMDTRMGRVEWGAGKARSRTSAAYWKQPMRWNAKSFRQCKECGWRGDDAARGHMAFDTESDTAPLKGCPSCGSYDFADARRRVFCASLADVFDNEVNPAWRADLFELIAATPNLDWLLLTKRIGNVARMAADACETIKLRWFVGVEYMRGKGDMRAVAWPLPNVWLGATICNQTEADRDIPKLLATPAAKRFLSIEPMLGPVYLFSAAPIECGHEGVIQCPETGAWECQACETRPAYEHFEDRLHWVIAGGESGPNARPSHPKWFRILRDDCAAAGVPFLFKQWGEWRPPLVDEDYNTSMGRAQRVPCYIVAPSGTVHCFENEWTTGGEVMRRVGKHAAGRLLDGVEHNGVPA